MKDHLFLFKNQHLHLHPQKALFWEEQSALILADLHLGKSAHFRKAGIAVPAEVMQEDLYRLQQLITYYQPEQLIFVGDLFHSSANRDLDYFMLWRRQFFKIKFHLIMGNHDILPKQYYEGMQLTLHKEQLILTPFVLAHEPPQNVNDEPLYYLSGHLHPGVKVKGAGKQSLRLPCFYFSQNYAVLPAFGGFTGLATINPAEEEKVFAIAGDQVLSL